MNGSTENRAPGAFEKSDRHEPVYNLAVAGRMLPLVRRVVDDIVQYRQRLARLRPEQDHLERQRRHLAWPQRCRRYQLQEEVALTEQHLQDALAELEVLGLALIDPYEGRIGFPTIVNNRAAFFSWRPGEDTLDYWHFTGEALRRPIPPGWREVETLRLLGKS